MLKGLLCAALLALAFALPFAQAFPEPTGVDGEDVFSVRVPEDGEDDDPDEGGYALPELIPGEDGWGWVIRVGPEIHFVSDGAHDGTVPEAWGDTFEWVSYCYEFGGLDAICGG